MDFPVFFGGVGADELENHFQLRGLLLSPLLCFFQRPVLSCFPRSRVSASLTLTYLLPPPDHSTTVKSPPQSFSMSLRDCSAGEQNTCCTCGGPKFSSQHPHGNSEMPVIPNPMDPSPSSSFHGYWACTRYTRIPEDTRDKNEYTSEERFLLKSSFIVCGSLALSV